MTTVHEFRALKNSSHKGLRSKSLSKVFKKMKTVTGGMLLTFAGGS